MSGKRPEPPRQKLLRNRARALRGDMPPAEAMLWNRLRGDEIGFRFRRQFRIDHYIADFACPAAKLIVEIDGESHAGREDYDMRRTLVIDDIGYRVIRFTDSQVLSDADAVVEAIYERCASVARPSPLPSPRVQGEGGSSL